MFDCRERYEFSKNAIFVTLRMRQRWQWRWCRWRWRLQQRRLLFRSTSLASASPPRSAAGLAPAAADKRQSVELQKPMPGVLAAGSRTEQQQRRHNENTRFHDICYIFQFWEKLKSMLRCMRATIDMWPLPYWRGRHGRVVANDAQQTAEAPQRKHTISR